MEDNALIASKPATTRFETLPTNLIDDPEIAMRSDMSRESIEDLVASIKQVGIIEPIVVRATGDRYEVIAGHRRITAAEAAGLEMVPCHVVEATQAQVETMKIHENLMRVDVNAADEAEHYARLIQTMKLSPSKIARMTNRSENYVRDRLQILDYLPELREALREGKLNLTVAKELNRIKDGAKLREMMGYAIGHGITGAVAKKWVDENLDQRQEMPFVADAGDSTSDFAPASAQEGTCFYCMNAVRLHAAYTVYVHEQCVTARQQQGSEQQE